MSSKETALVRDVDALDEKTLTDVAAELADAADEIGAYEATVSFKFPRGHELEGCAVHLTVELPGYDEDEGEAAAGEETDDDEPTTES